MYQAIDLIGPYKVHRRPHRPERTKEDQKGNKKSTPPQNAVLLLYIGITPYSDGDCLILTFVNRYKAYIFDEIII